MGKYSWQAAEGRGQRTASRQRSEVRKKSEVRDQRSGVRGKTDFCRGDVAKR